jgi:hypothetical protein
VTIVCGNPLVQWTKNVHRRWQISQAQDERAARRLQNEQRQHQAAEFIASVINEGHRDRKQAELDALQARIVAEGVAAELKEIELQRDLQERRLK